MKDLFPLDLSSTKIVKITLGISILDSVNILTFETSQFHTNKVVISALEINKFIQSYASYIYNNTIHIIHHIGSFPDTVHPYKAFVPRIIVLSLGRANMLQTNNVNAYYRIEFLPQL